MSRDEHTRTILARRVWLNDDPTMHARILTELKVYQYEEHVEISAGVDLADCARTAAIDLWAFDKEEAESRLQKLDRMIEELLTLRDEYYKVTKEVFNETI